MTDSDFEARRFQWTYLVLKAQVQGISVADILHWSKMDESACTDCGTPIRADYMKAHSVDCFYYAVGNVPTFKAASDGRKCCMNTQVLCGPCSVKFGKGADVHIAWSDKARKMMRESGANVRPDGLVFDSNSNKCDCCRNDVKVLIPCETSWLMKNEKFMKLREKYMPDEVKRTFNFAGGERIDRKKHWMICRTCYKEIQ